MLSIDSNFKIYVSSSLSSARHGMGSTVSGRKVFFAGGCTIDDFSSAVDVYDYTAGKWSTLSSGLSLSRCLVSAASVAFKVIFVGGHQYEVSQSIYNMYDTISGAWVNGDISSARHALASTSINGKIAIFASGYSSYDSSVTNVADIYNVTSNTWSTYGLSVASQWPVAISLATTAYVAGGTDVDQTNAYRNVDTYNYITNSWSSSSTALSIGRSYFAVAAVGPYLVFGGGHTGFSTSNVVDIYNYVTNIWSTSSLATARAAHAATSLGCKAIFAGGKIWDQEIYYSSIEVYDLSTSTWTVLSVVLGAGVGFLSAATVGTTVIFAGGATTSTSNFLSLSCVFGASPINGICSCPAGKFANSTACEACPADTYSSIASISCSSCPAGYYSSSGSSACSACPAGIYFIVFFFNF